MLIDLDKISEEYLKNKLEINDICIKYNCSYKYIWQKLKRAGILRVKNNRSLDLTGQIFGNIKAIKKLKKDYKGSWIWLCECSCGKICKIRASQLKRGEYKSCGCIHKTCGSGNRLWKGFGEIHKSTWGKIVYSAEQRNCDFDISIEFAWNLYLSQDRKCAISGLPIIFAKSYLNKKESTASLDRIDSKKGYVKDNVQWVHKIVNKMKTNLDQEKFIEFCIEISKFQNKGNSC